MGVDGREGHGSRWSTGLVVDLDELVHAVAAVDAVARCAVIIAVIILAVVATVLVVVVLWRCLRRYQRSYATLGLTVSNACAPRRFMSMDRCDVLGPQRTPQWSRSRKYKLCFVSDSRSHE